jgi:hypothetical protein
MLSVEEGCQELTFKQQKAKLKIYSSLAQLKCIHRKMKAFPRFAIQ